ncbi:adenylyltransferase [Scheffersomyces coipomensis]|uniref:adenylyltransferase n=1 Tax=Scheffersomyces coipomensis TaxID=1788519 RepID=UPI00315CA2C5
MSKPSYDELLSRIKELELENEKLKQVSKPSHVSSDSQTLYPKVDEYFSLDEYKRYGRQMIVTEFGSLPSQIKLKKSSILVVGAGGLGCPALLYLSAAGIGKIGIIDDDIVDISNLHRQVLHTTDNVGMYKCDSAKKYISRLNPHVTVETYPFRLSNDNAFEIISKYDLVLDCTDAPAARYLINDVSVLCGKTIVSGSGLKSDGQLSILNFENFGPCYRCFYPKPPAPESVTSCSDGGVIGPAIGLVGLTMAIETIKVLTDYYTKDNFKPFLAQYTGYPHQQIRQFKMRNRKPDCGVCGDSPQIDQSTIESNAINYAAFCGKFDPNVLDAKYRINVKQLHDIKNPILIDVRPKEQFQITKLPNSINIQWDPIFKKLDSIDDYLPSDFNKELDEVYVICRYGNDSQLAAKKLIEEFKFPTVKDVIGGLNQWSDQIDPKIPKY